MTVALSPDEARRLTLTAQGLIGSPFPVNARTAPTAPEKRRRAAVQAVLAHVGAVQLDTISVLARSHELVPYARLGAVGRGAVESAYWSDETPAHAFEYWSHAACILPDHLWPWFAFRRRHYQRKGERWHTVNAGTLDSLRRRLREEGPLTTRDVGGAKTSSEWWDWSEAKVGMEWLLDIGEVVVSRREGWRRVYDLPERVLSHEHQDRAGVNSRTWSSAEGIDGPDDEECVRHLIELGVRSVGIGTVSDILDVHRLRTTLTSRQHVASVFADLVEAGVITAVTVPGWRGPVYADARLLASGPARGRHRTTLLSPFDSLIWHRGRTERVFGFDHLFEPYVPQAKRLHGYFTMPVLHGGHLVARVDPKRRGDVLDALTVILETTAGAGVQGSPLVPGAIEGTAAALVEAAAWVGCSSVHLGDVRPSSARRALESALRSVD